MKNYKYGEKVVFIGLSDDFLKYGQSYIVNKPNFFGTCFCERTPKRREFIGVKIIGENRRINQNVHIENFISIKEYRKLKINKLTKHEK